MPVADFFLIFVSSVLVSSQKNFGAIGSEVPRSRRPKEEEYCSEFLDVSALNEEAEKPTMESSKEDLETLAFRWTFWYDSSASQKKVSKRDYLSSLNQLATISTLPEFFTEWRKIYEKMIPTYQAETNFRFFRHQILPMWEDSNNSNGGKWVVVFRQRPSQKTTQMWQSLLISMMIGDLGHENDLCGAVLSIRTWGFMYTLWNKNSEDKAQIEEISQKLAGIFQTPKIKYQSHRDAIQKTSQAARQQKEIELREKKAKKSLKQKENRPQNIPSPIEQAPPPSSNKPKNSKKQPKEEAPSKPENPQQSPNGANPTNQEKHLNAGYISSDNESADSAIPSIEAEGNQPNLVPPPTPEVILEAQPETGRDQPAPYQGGTKSMQMVCKKEEGSSHLSILQIAATVALSGAALVLSAHLFY